MASSNRNFLRASAAISMAIGITCYVNTHPSNAWLDSIMKACKEPPSDKNSAITHAFAPFLGGSFVCVITQILHAATASPAGAFCYLTIMSLYVPTFVFTSIESGRNPVDGSEKHKARAPVVVWAAGQLLGYGVAIPCMFISSYFWGGVLPDIPSTFDTRRAPVAVILAIPIVALAVLLCSISADSLLWTLAAGVVGGPTLALFGIVLVPLQRFEGGDASSCHRSAGAAYAASSFITLAMYAYGSFQLVTSYESIGFALSAMWGPKAQPATSFMAVNTFCMAAGMALLVAVRGKVSNGGWKEGLMTVGLAPIVGPGAAVSIALMTQEYRCAERAFSEPSKSKKE
mmetsp:Transcript_15672/g.31217  ORF Transcript_15672/g.31217 Transcript_15672/m.31217 type:complete len:344 (+) Transcript_15672:150-1181(+)|eukprot:CAMPEP_0194330704 /NCGR_PEP_ID=MMETSP0171-20130528/52933_1 /TAXON_ID=218684 /ORGANISM="Corethron pennatum, Strain L29A3" /LENGTH=343 /DNA_ID=CAMNT_0039091869 /DNA_START=87 /DNA_END=1118 /DNA_ORIENTATION=-